MDICPGLTLGALGEVCTGSGLPAQGRHSSLLASALATQGPGDPQLLELLP